MIGESSPISGTDAFARRLADYERRIADLERLAQGGLAWAEDSAALGAFPAAAYTYPASPTSLSTYSGLGVMFTSGTVARAGIYTVTAAVVLMSPTSDGGRIDIALNMGGSPRSTSGHPVFGAVAFTTERWLDAGDSITWQMYKHTDTAAYTTTEVQFGIGYRSGR